MTTLSAHSVRFAYVALRGKSPGILTGKQLASFLRKHGDLIGVVAGNRWNSSDVQRDVIAIVATLQD